jgi:hypothetical protein
MGGFAAQPRLPPRARGFARAVCQMAPHLRPCFAQARAARYRCTCLSPHRRSSRSPSHRRRGAGGGPSARCLLLACCLLSLLTCRPPLLTSILFPEEVRGAFFLAQDFQPPQTGFCPHADFLNCVWCVVAAGSSSDCVGVGGCCGE